MSSVSNEQKKALSDQVKIAGANYPALIAANDEKQNAALITGNIDEARRLGIISSTLRDQLIDLIHGDIKAIDDSSEMTDAIKGFTDINKDIEDAIKHIKQLTDFVNAITAIAGLMDKLITSTVTKA